MLSSEISTIYKRDERTRKVHHLLYAPSLDAVDSITRALGRVGNLASDGRPILGLDSRDLLEITLGGGEGCYLVPAHAWTPWFAVLGSQSGFDRVADCYADLAGHIFAIETGLSSDPEMNWRVSSLDDYRLVSNSDAHSPPMLGREATAFDLPEPGYFGIRQALRTGEGFGGTVEFFPEEGKYHLDGHRACGVRSTPQETQAAGGVCPVCGKKPTIGVQHRVDVLADRPEGYRVRGAADFASFVPLPEILGEIAGVGPKSKSVTAQVTALVERFGPELSILGDVPLGDLAAGAPSIVAEAIARLRRGEVRREAGYDGVYGTIRLFDPAELAGAALFDLPRPARKSTAGRAAPAAAGTAGPAAAPAGTGGSAVPADSPGTDFQGAVRTVGLDPEQQAIVAHDDGPLLVVAGPGAGKTRVLTHTIARRIEGGLPAERCLAITFTRRARDELRDRLAGLLDTRVATRVTVQTFHGIGLLILREQHALLGFGRDPQVADERIRNEVLRLLSAGDSPAALGTRIAEAKRARGAGLAADSELAADAGLDKLLAQYDAELRSRGLVDVDDLVTLPASLLADDPALAAGYRARWSDVFVDEYQDVDAQQYRLLCLLSAPGARICAIGDPDQAIYGFRGGDVGYFLRFAEDFGSTAEPVTTVRLSRSYRSAPSIVRAAMQLIRPGTLVPGRELIPARTDIPDAPVLIRQVADDREEAEAIAASIEKMLGGASFHALDSLAVDSRDRTEHQLSFADFAVLYRTSPQAGLIMEALAKRGFPVQRRSHSRLAELPGVELITAALRAAVPDESPAPVTELVAAAAEAALAALAALAGPGGDGRTAGLTDRAGSHRERAAALAAIRGAAELLGPLAARAGTDLELFLGDLAAGTEADTWDPRADRITLLTLHASKGLEFPVVFIAGCDDGLLPLRSWHGADVDYAEERRLLFVGMTRATTRLTMLSAARRMLRGEVTDCTPSPFLSSIDQDLLDRHGPKSRSRRKPKPQAHQPALF
jgi:uncharacterized protein (TIGR00375 family)